MNYGFIKPTIEAKQYVLGNVNVPFKVLKEDGDWRDNMRPVKEIQFNDKFDTYNCTSYNTLNQIEQYMYVAFKETVNYSDRWLGIIAGTKPPGNDPHIVYEAIRKYGLIPEDMLPYSDDLTSVDEYYSFKGADMEACYAEGRKWLEKYDFMHEWCFDPQGNIPNDEKVNNIKASLKASPVSFAVFAWVEDSRGVYIRLGGDVHWTSCMCYDDLQRVFDSYDPVEKPVDQEIFYAKRIHIEKKTMESKKETLLTKLWQWFLKEKLIYRAFKIFWIKNK
tara:strand:+ start:157 stop:987 length:831 start_codon:yes stop_codon:yes gene_type:complete